MRMLAIRCELALLLMIVLILAGTIAYAGEVVTIDGVPHIRNDAEPSQGKRTMQMQELWRIGGDDDDAFFGLITQLLSDKDGNIYILDSQLCEVQVYTSEGKHLKTLFRAGEGPGEVRRARNLALLGDGSVGVIQEFPGTMIRADKDNNPVASVELHKPGRDGFMILDGCFAGGETLVFSGTHAQQRVDGIQNRLSFLGIFSQAGEEMARLAEAPYVRNYRNLVIAESVELPAFFWASCVGPDGMVYTAPDRDKYAIKVFSPSGKLERVVEREYQHYKRSQTEWQRLYDAIEGLLQGADIEIKIEIEKNDYDILAMQHGVRVREDNSLWVLPSRGAHDQPPGVMLTFDVFDPAGHFIEQVSFACEGDGIWDGFFFVGEDRVVVVTGHVEGILAQYGGGTNTYDSGEGAAMEVICYQIEK